MQVVTVFRLLEQLPAVATAAFMQHELATTAAARQQAAQPVQQQYQELLHLFQQHKEALHPGMAQPGRYHCTIAAWFDSLLLQHMQPSESLKRHCLDSSSAPALQQLLRKGDRDLHELP